MDVGRMSHSNQWSEEVGEVSSTFIKREEVWYGWRHGVCCRQGVGLENWTYYYLREKAIQFLCVFEKEKNTEYFCVSN